MSLSNSTTHADENFSTSDSIRTTNTESVVNNNNINSTVKTTTKSAIKIRNRNFDLDIDGLLHPEAFASDSNLPSTIKSNVSSKSIRNPHLDLDMDLLIRPEAFSSNSPPKNSLNSKTTIQEMMKQKISVRSKFDLDMDLHLNPDSLYSGVSNSKINVLFTYPKVIATSASMETQSTGKDDFEAKRRDKTLHIAAVHATKYALAGGSIASVGTLLASKYNHSFSTYMSTSAKTSIPVMTALFLFALQYELKMIEVGRNPTKYGIMDQYHMDSESQESQKRAVVHLPFYQRAMNYLHDHPFQLITGLSVPFIGGVIYQQLGIKHLTLSQRLMNSRVFGQAGLLTITLTVLGFRDYMDRNGKFGAERIKTEDS